MTKDKPENPNGFAFAQAPAEQIPAGEGAIRARKDYLLQTIAAGSNEIKRLQSQLAAVAGSVERSCDELLELEDTKIIPPTYRR